MKSPCQRQPLGKYLKTKVFEAEQDLHCRECQVVRQRRAWTKRKAPEKACKPGPVSRACARPDGHFSRTPVTRRLKRPYPRAPRGPRFTRTPGLEPDVGIALLFDLAPGGVYRAGAVTRAAGELLPHRFTLTALSRARRSAFCGTGPWGRPPWPLAS